MRHKVTADPSSIAGENLGKINCISCGAVVTEKFCGICGEKRLSTHDLSLKHFAEESFEGITHFDNKFFRSAKLLLIKPGLLSLYFSSGKRVDYMRPFALFFVCNLMFFLLVGQNNVFSLSLYNFYNFKPYTHFHTREIIEQIAVDKGTFAIVTQSFNEKMGIQSKAFLLFFIPFLSLGGLIIGRKKYLSEHLVFSTNYFSFIILYYTITQLLIAQPFYNISGINYSSTFDLAYSLCALAVFMLYYGLAAMRFYRIPAITAAFGAVVTGFIFLVFLYAYRLILFYKIITSITI